MNAEQKIKHLVILRALLFGDVIDCPVTAENVDGLFTALENQQDAMSEVREGEVETGLECEYSRHYESKAVAAELPDGTWVGWTYWYGGGKHSEPDAMDWIGEAYLLDCVAEEKVVVVRTFAKKEVEL